MANSSLSQTDIDGLIAKLKEHPFLATIGSTSIGPLEGPPEVEPDIKTKERTLYETGEKTVGKKITQYNMRLTLKTRDVDAAMTLLEAVKEGDNPLASTNAKSITLAPITDTATEKGFTFGNAYLAPERCKINYGENDEPNSVTLSYDCLPMTVSNSNTRLPFSYAVLS